MTLKPEPLTAEAFAPFGEVLTVPEAAGRLYYEAALANGRAGAWPSLSLSCKEPEPARRLRVEAMERHEFSSQSFVPLGAAAWLVLVAPHGADGGPDMARARAFLPGPGQAVTYGINVWHHGMTVFGAPARFAVFMWRDGGPGDEEFVPVEPFTLDLD
ncbi:ureidoglycolate lyase [Roseomonas sp. KE0001]|uniref:ureidoglycolate lyase n=1 Tax=unclassified Roseomonas TaxID=2617492 RepID=UPI0018DF0D0F|nr:ureidoglycolate lyase [Roseomonas sp. KE0001]MBI0434637.1 ureidoglycolate hydrolase [Roseomonas sp. KE0001]